MAWINLTFGCALTGKAAVRAKNVMVPPVDPTAPRSSGRVKLFATPHPPRVNNVIIPKPLSSSTSNDHVHVHDRDHVHVPLTGSEPIVLSSDPAALIYSLDPAARMVGCSTPSSPGGGGGGGGGDWSEEDESSPPSLSFRRAKRADLAALGRLFAAVYAKNPSLAEASDGDVRVAAASLSLSVRSVVLRLTGLAPSSAADNGTDDGDDDDDDDEHDEDTVVVPSAAAVRDSTLFPRHVRESAVALATLRSIDASSSGVERVEVGRAVAMGAVVTAGG